MIPPRVPRNVIFNRRISLFVSGAGGTLTTLSTTGAIRKTSAALATLPAKLAKSNLILSVYHSAAPHTSCPRRG